MADIVAMEPTGTYGDALRQAVAEAGLLARHWLEATEWLKLSSATLLRIPPHQNSWVN